MRAFVPLLLVATVPLAIPAYQDSKPAAYLRAER